MRNNTVFTIYYKIISGHQASYACGTCPVCWHNVNLEVFTPWGVSFFCCHDYVCTACDVCVWFEMLEKLNIISGGGKKQNFRGQEWVLVRGKQSCPLRLKLPRDRCFNPYTKESRTSNSANVEWCHMLGISCFCLYGRSWYCHATLAAWQPGDEYGH